MHELRVMAVAELHVNAAYHNLLHAALKSVYEKSQSVMISSYIRMSAKTETLSQLYDLYIILKLLM